MIPSDIPGYAYDSERRRYFKIAHNDIPNFVTQRQVNSVVITQETHAKVVRLTEKCLVDLNSSLIYQLNEREYFWKSTGFNVYRQFGLTYGRNFQHKESFIHHGFGKCILSPDGYWLHAIHENILESFQLSWESKEKNCDRLQGKFRFRKRKSVNMDWLPGFTPKDISWIEPGRVFTIVGNIAHRSAMIFVECIGSNYFVHPLRTLPIGNVSSLKFATTPDCTDTCFLHVSQQLNSAVMDSNDYEPERNESGREVKGKIVLFSDKDVHLYSNGKYRTHCLPHKNFRNKVEQMSITACAMAESASFIQSETALVYLATSDRSLELTHLFKRPFLKFNTINEPPSGIKEKDYRITSLKAVLTPTGVRRGVLVGRHCGLLQLWDERWPKMPAVHYPESAASSRLCTLASHIPMQPIVGTLFHQGGSVVAFPLLGSSCIVLWQLSTGQPLNVLQPPPQSTAEAQPSAPPPQIFLRSTWPGFNGLPRRGPALMTVEQCTVHCFYV